MANLDRIGAGQQQPSALLGCQLFCEVALCSIEFFATCDTPRRPAGVAQCHETRKHRFEQLAFIFAQLIFPDILRHMGQRTGHAADSAVSFDKVVSARVALSPCFKEWHLHQGEITRPVADIAADRSEERVALLFIIVPGEDQGRGTIAARPEYDLDPATRAIPASPPAGK
jgi:hypothetical protein